MLKLSKKWDFKKNALNAIRDFAPFTKAPLSEIYDGRLEKEKVLLTERGLIIHVNNNQNPLKDAIVSKSIWLEMAPTNEGLELHLWNTEGVITTKPLLFTGNQIFGSARHLLEGGSENPRGIQCILLFEQESGLRELKAFPSPPEVKNLVCDVLGITRPIQTRAEAVTFEIIPNANLH